MEELNMNEVLKAAETWARMCRAAEQAEKLAKGLVNADQVIQEKTLKGQQLQSEIDRLEALCKAKATEHEEQCKVYEGRYKDAQESTEALILEAQKKAKELREAAEKLLADSEKTANDTARSIIEEAQNQVADVIEKRRSEESRTDTAIALRERAESDLKEVERRLAEARKQVAGILNPGESKA